MLHLIVNLILRLLLCAVITYLAWREAELIGLVFSSLVIGLALSSPILELLINLRQLIKHGAFSNLNGRYYAFQERAIDIIEDDNHECWLSLADVRMIIKGFPRDSVIVKLYPDDILVDKKNGESRIRSRALVNYLQSSTNVNAIKFKIWIERELIFPRKQLMVDKK